jgi:hypothetical protein
MILGTGINEQNPLTNDNPASLMIGYNTNQPSVYVGSGDGFNGPGAVALGHDEPLAQNHIRGSLVVDGFGTGHGQALPAGPGSRLVYAPQLGAFRAGTVSGSQWNVPGTITLVPATDNSAVLTFTIAPTAIPSTYPCQLMLFSEGHHKALPFTFIVT